MTRWFRHYSGMMRDEKLVRAAVKSCQSVERVVWIWGAILESASEINDGGRYEVDSGEISYFLRCDESDVSRVLASLSDIGRLVDGVVAKWSDRQFDSDISRERQRRYRERRANADVSKGQGDAEDRGGDVTPPSRDAEVTLQETDNRLQKQKEKKDTTASPPACDLFEEFWKVYPRRDGENPKKPARAKFEAICRKGADPQAIIAAARRLAAKHPTPTPYVPQAVTWINQERWADDPTQTGPPSENIVRFRTVDEIMAQVEALNG